MIHLSEITGRRKIKLRTYGEMGFCGDPKKDIHEFYEMCDAYEHYLEEENKCPR